MMRSARPIEEADALLPRLAAELAAWELASLPGEVVAKAKTCVLDMLAGCFALPGDRRVVAARVASSPVAGGPGAAIFGTALRVGAAEAAFANAVASAVAETNDTHAPSATHPGIVIVPAVLALAEAEALSGAAALCAIVAGYETMGRLARAVISPELVKTFRSSGIVGPTASALAAAFALRIPPAEIANAAALSTHTASGFNEWANAGTDEHVFHIGFAARNGVIAAQLARFGVIAAPTVLEGRAGLFAAFGAGKGAADRVLRQTDGFEILHVIHKPAPACFFVQTPCQVAGKLTEAGIDPKNIAEIEIFVSRAAAAFPGCDNPGPMATRQDASMSIQFSVASVVANGGIRHSNWEDYADPAVNALASRCTLVADDALSRAYPGRNGAGIRLSSRAGDVFSKAADDFVSMSPDDVTARFLESAGPAIGVSRAERVVETVGHLETLDTVARLSALLAAPGAEDAR